MAVTLPSEHDRGDEVAQQRDDAPAGDGAGARVDVDDGMHLFATHFDAVIVTRKARNAVDAHPGLFNTGSGQGRGDGDIDLGREQRDGVLGAAGKDFGFARGVHQVLVEHRGVAQRSRAFLRGDAGFDGAHQRRRAQNVEAADGARGEVDAAFIAPRRGARLFEECGVGEGADREHDEVGAGLKRGQGDLAHDLWRGGLDDIVRRLCEQFGERGAGQALCFCGKRGRGLRVAVEGSAEFVLRQQALVPGVDDDVAEEAAADEGEFFLAHGVLSEKVEKEIECVKEREKAEKMQSLKAEGAIKNGS